VQIGESRQENRQGVTVGKQRGNTGAGGEDMKTNVKTDVKANGLALEWTLERKGKRAARGGGAGTESASAAACAGAGKLPRVARLMALAIKLQDLVDRGDVRHYAEIAQLGHVTRARMTQLMNLLLLAPDIQENLLFLPPTKQGRDPVSERSIRTVAATHNWRRQRTLWLAKFHK
jgi:hypothetical protein